MEFSAGHLCRADCRVLAAGNTVIAKPAEQTPLVADLAVALFHEAGVPRPVLQCLPGQGGVGAALVADERVRGVLFSGSAKVAAAIHRQWQAGECAAGGGDRWNQRHDR
jgi:RHH-type proline utilization regulon transcriptional repressor/proline dehydrogenase/delta 1-pyrroline-5-carboxylate dehydrogenase